MKKINCIPDNCIITPSGCVEWNGGDVAFLGICNGESLNTIMLDIINMLEDITEADLASFDIDGLLSICSQKAPTEINLLSILKLLRDNEICLKDYIDVLNEKIADLSTSSNIIINLKCFADFDNLGNALSITREQLDQLVINQLCDHKLRIETLEGKITVLQTDILNIDINPVVDEPSFEICINTGDKTTSENVKDLANHYCDIKDPLVGSTGDGADITSALAKTEQAEWNTEFSTIVGWDISPGSWAENYGNLLLAFNNLLNRIQTIEDTCCASTCEDIKLGFTAIFNEDMTGVIIKFTSGAGTFIPAGFIDKGTTGTITDKDGNSVTFNMDVADNFTNNLEEEISVSGLNLTEDLEIDITVKLGTDSLTCEKCVHKLVKSSACGYCEISASGAEGSSAVVIYEAGEGDILITIPVAEEVEDSTTTTTTEAPAP